MAKLLLRAGDILLYRSKGLYGRLISLKTWHNIGHVELYDGLQRSLASRDGLGVNAYPIRLNELAYVLRPTVRLDLAKGRAWFAAMRGAPYGWLDMLNFVGIPVNRGGIVCSPFVAGFLRAAGWNVFPTDVIERVAPFQFLDLVGRDCEIAYGPEEIRESLI